LRSIIHDKMDDLINVLRYVGTILIGFQIVGQIGYVDTLLSLPLAIPIIPLFNRFADRSNENRAKRAFYFNLFLINSLIFIAVGIGLSPLMVLYFASMLLLDINRMLNSLLRYSMKPWKDIYLFGLHFNLNLTSKLEDDVFTDNHLWDIPIEKRDSFFSTVRNSMCYCQLCFADNAIRLFYVRTFGYVLMNDITCSGYVRYSTSYENG
jgi:hypothetical protein